MQAQYQLITPNSQKVITAVVVAFLAVLAMVPVARAMSLVPDGESSARSSALNAETTRDQIQFLEDNWYFSVPDSEVSENAADRFSRIVEFRALNVNDFEAMEQAPGLYTDSSDIASPAEESSVEALLAHDEIKFLYDNWYFGFGDDGADDNQASIESSASTDDSDPLSQNLNDFDAMERAPGLYTVPSDAANSGLTHDEIKFLHDNWNFSSGGALLEDDADEPGSASSTERYSDRADTLDGMQGGTGADHSHDEFTYPWGGFQEFDY
jgi:hypothetical protein